MSELMKTITKNSKTQTVVNLIVCRHGNQSNKFQSRIGVQPSNPRKIFEQAI